MTLHRLPGGTDVAEMALFDVDSLPHERPRDGERFDELVARNRLIRFPTGGDGGYLLHLYVNESPPAHVMQYCLTDDPLCGEFFSPSGRIAFGGVESAFDRFQPNKHIRSDTVIAPGNYTYKAYRTDIPDEAIEAALQRVPSTPAERWLDRAPMVITLTTLGLVGLFLSLKIYWSAGIAAVLGHLLFKGVKRIPGHDALSVRREQAQMDFDVPTENPDRSKLEVRLLPKAPRGARRSDEEVPIQRRADCLCAANGRRRQAGGGRLPPDRYLGGHVLHVEEEVWRAGRERAAQAQAA